MDQAHSWAERGAYLFAGVAVVSLQQAAWIMTCLAAFVSVLCGAIKIYDWFRLGKKID